MPNQFYDQVELIFFKYGLYSSRHPVSMICVSAVMILLSCYPLLDLPIPGSEPQQCFTLLSDLQDSGHAVGHVFPEHIQKQELPYWLLYMNQTAYIQQFVVKSSIKPWPATDISNNDGFKAALSSVFKIVDEIRNFSSSKGSIFQDCLHISDTVIKPKQRIKTLFPEDGCLIVSPAAYWNNKLQMYIDDPNIKKTINQFESKSKPIKTPPSIKELLFGLSSKQSGVNIPLQKNKQYTVSFAVTLVLQKYDPALMEELKARLYSLYSYPILRPYHRDCVIKLHSKKGEVCSNLSEIVSHIYYKPQMRFNDLIPLLSTYFFLGCYIYFSVRKINFVKSKLGMAFSAVVSVMASLMMSVGLCSLIGLTPTLNGGQIFPYLVCIIGLENILVITKSVVATPTHLDVDSRIALGLSREGCSIIKNLLLEFVLIALGYFTFVPEIKEFCAFAFVGILSDLFMNMMFFVTVLSIDIRRLDITEENYSYSDETGNQEIDTGYLQYNSNVKKRSHVRRKLSKEPTASVENGGKDRTILKIPKRLRLVFFFADTRMIQRGLMVSMVIWFSVLMYSFPDSSPTKGVNLADHKQQAYLNLDSIISSEEMDDKLTSVGWNHRDLVSFNYLSFRHWPTLFAYYNITLAERFISVLPSILIPVTLDHDNAKHIIDSQSNKKEPIFPESPLSRESINLHLPSHFYTGRYQMTGLDYYLTLLLGAVSGMFMVFLLNIMYHCVCSRNYGNNQDTTSQTGTSTSYSSSVPSGDSVPLLLEGHSQMVECVHVEGVMITSADITGELRTWDSHSGECTSVISRSKHVLKQRPPLNRTRFEVIPNPPSTQEVAGPAIWSLTSSGQFTIVGCDNGQIEVWDSVTTSLQCKYSGGKSGIVGIACEESRVVAARLNGTLDFFIIDTIPQVNNQAGSSSEILLDLATSSIRLQLLHTVKCAHQQPISAFEMCMRRVLTGSCDHTIKLFNFQDSRCQFSMFGHTGPITVLYMDKQVPAGAVSGSTDTTVRLWDLLSGACLHKLEGHHAAITSAQCSTHHVVSTAQDDKLCIWARQSGVLLHITRLDSGSSCPMSLLGQNWCVTGGNGCLLLWDIRNGELLRRVPLLYGSVVRPSVGQVHVASDFCVCVLGHDLHVVRFPAVLEKN